jgi:signal transduction histidine kinase
VPNTPHNQRWDLVLWMVVLRRITVLAGFGAVLFQRLVSSEDVPLNPAMVIILAICLYNEIGRWIVKRAKPERLSVVVNTQVALDTVALTALLHFGGGLTSPGLMFFAPAFFAYGVVLPLPNAFIHVVSAAVELGILGVLEGTGVVRHFGSGFYVPGAYTQPSFIGLTTFYITVVNALCTYLSHHLRALLRTHEEHTLALAAERVALLERNERDAARVRALLDVAQHVSGSNSVENLLCSVCDTTIALVRVPRVEVFLWDGDRSCLRLVASRGLADQTSDDEERSYPADLPIVSRLRAGEVVEFGAAPSFVPGGVQLAFRRGFAAPMMCRGSFEGALFVGFGDETPEEILALVQGIARQAALALANVRTIEQQQEDAEVSRILLEISQALNTCLDEEALWSLLARGASEVIGLPWSVAGRYNERDGKFSIAGRHGVPNGREQRFTTEAFRAEQFPALQEVVSSRDLVVSDTAATPAFPLPEGDAVGSWLAIPLYRGSWIAGFLAAGTSGPRKRFSRRQLRLAQELGHHASIALQNARLVADLEAADQLKSEFVSTMSHELRTPLNVIIGYTEMLREGAFGPVNENQREMIDRLDARGRELLELIEATLHVGRLEAGRDTVEILPVEMGDLLRALQACTSGLPRPPSVAFEWEVPLDARDRVVMTDRAKLALVVRNLVSNAFKFTTDGKVVVRMGMRGDTLVVEVRDTGIGIGAEHLPIIFDMFRQVDGSMTRRHGGVGLGLYIVKQFVTRLGGAIDVKSTPGQGSTFRVVIPGAVRAESARPTTNVVAA